MSAENNPKWYIIDMAAPPQPPREDGWGHHDRNELPAYKLIGAKRFGKEKPLGVKDDEEGGRYDCGPSFREFTDFRRSWIRTARHADIEEIGKLPGVTVTEAVPSGFYYISGIIFDKKEGEELNSLNNDYAGSRKYLDGLSEKFDAAWPQLKSRILETIQQYDPAALLYDCDTKSAQAVMIKTDSTALVAALWRLDGHILLNEFEPGTTLDEVTKLYEYWMEPVPEEPEPPAVATPAQGLVP